MRAGVTVVVRNAVPRCTAQASRTWAGVFLTRCAMLTIFEQLPFREIRMGFDLHDRRLDSRGLDNLPQFLQIDIR